MGNFNNGTLGEYSIAGQTINADLISGLAAAGIAIGPGPAPLLSIAPVGNQSALFYPYSLSGTNYVLQTITNVASTNWITVTNGMPVIGVLVTNNLPGRSFRIAPGN